MNIFCEQKSSVMASQGVVVWTTGTAPTRAVHSSRYRLIFFFQVDIIPCVQWSIHNYVQRCNQATPAKLKNQANKETNASYYCWFF